jgi:hypothetical protein
MNTRVGAFIMTCKFAVECDEKISVKEAIKRESINFIKLNFGAYYVWEDKASRIKTCGIVFFFWYMEL